MGEGIAVRTHEHVAELVLDRPEAMNAVSTGLARALTETTARLAADASVRAVVLTSSHERAFCVGADLKERNAFTDADMHRHRPTSRAAYTGVLELPMPAIAAVHGFALGGGTSWRCPATSSSPTRPRWSGCRRCRSGWCRAAAGHSCCPAGWAPRAPRS